MASFIRYIKKKGGPKEPESYRPITLTSALGKVFSSILDTRLRILADTNEMISKEQAGFRKGFSTADNIFCPYSFMQLYLTSGKKLYCAYIDVRKAFDTVWRIGLWQKLLKNGVTGKIFEKRKSRKNDNFYLNNNKIEIVNSHFYLGLLFQFNGIFCYARKRLVAQTEKSSLCFIYQNKKHIHTTRPANEIV